MQVYFSPNQLAHAPAHQLLPAGLAPHPEPAHRATVLLEALVAAGHTLSEPALPDMRWIQRVHTAAYLEFLEGAWAAWQAREPGGALLFPSTFPRRVDAPPPADLADCAGWYCFDTYTPLCETTFSGAMASAASALAAAKAVLQGERSAYALCRPPGHHAGPGYCGGFCYLNNAAIAARCLAHETQSRGAVLDLDYHHGNGTQDIFYTDPAVMVLSIHGDPGLAYPYIAGHADERGAGEGLGTNLNLPLPPGASKDRYMGALAIALEALAQFGPSWLVVSFGADVCAGDPEGAFELLPGDLEAVGAAVAGLGIPAAVVQEGGYNIDNLGPAVVQFLRGLS
ncbi:MAG: histone deacetylase family protein [Candidatus Hydrogenedentes bacterium]|nr:histone deacetylase family protein [Candidatus Hydrogenedentota bacterium]